MNVEKYTNCCKKFAEETREWAGLRSFSRYYTSKDDCDWAETCDNAHGGLDVSWAFHVDDANIEKYASKAFCYSVAEDLLALADNETDYDTFRNRICELMELR